MKTSAMFSFGLLLLHITTIEGVFKVEKICSRQSKVINCSGDSVIKIVQARIEKQPDGTCASDLQTSGAMIFCEKSKSMEAVRESCEYRSECVVSFADCKDLLKIIYRCENQPQVTTPLPSSPSSSVATTTFNGCLGTTRRGIFWPQTAVNDLLRQNCSEDYEGGEAWWMCSENGVWIGEPNLFECTRRALLELNNELTEESLHLLGNDTFVELIEFSGEAATGGDLKTIHDILMKLMQFQQLNSRFLPSLLDVVGLLLDERKVEGWKEVPGGSFHLWNLIMSLESIFSMETQDLHHVHKNFELQVSSVKNQFRCVNGVVNFVDLVASSDDGVAQLSSRECHKASGSGTDSILLVNFRNIIPLLGGRNMRHLSNLFLVSTKHNWTLSDNNNNNNLTIVFKLNVLGQKGVSCFRWSPFTNSSEALECKRLWSNGTHVSCQCPHPSAYVAMETTKTAPSVDPQSSTPPIAAYIGCVLGISGLIVSSALYAYIIYRHKKDIRHRVYLNYSICQAVNTCTSLIGLSRTKLETVCTISALVLHYCSLVSLMWLLCGSFNIYLCLILARRKRSFSQEAWFYVISSTLPLIVLIISAALSFDSYKSPNSCWLSNNSGFEWVFIGPAILIFWFSVALSCVSWKTLKESSREASCIGETNRLLLLKSGLKRLILLIILSNLAWSSWLLHAYLSHLFFAYLFSMFCTLIGLLVLFDAAMEVKVRPSMS